MLLQLDIAGFSELVSVHGKARLADNSLALLPKGIRSSWALTSSSIGRYHGVLRLVAKHHGNAEHGNIKLKEH